MCAQGNVRGAFMWRRHERSMRSAVMQLLLAACCLAIGGMTRGAHAAELTVLSVSPKNATVHAPVVTPIVVHFDRPVLPRSVTPSSFWAFARTSGTVTGNFVFSDGNATVTLIPDDPFFWGEPVTVLLSHDLVAADGSPMRAAGYAFRFTTRVRASPLSLAVVNTLSTNIAHESSVPYGGNPADLNHDGFADVVLANEGTDDIRVFPNAADGTVALGPIVEPTAHCGDTPSPSDFADFDHDGDTDIVVGHYGDGTIGVLLGNGDGTFGPVQSIVTTASATVGVTALDVDGDGDFDVAGANPFAGNVSISINQGNGVFGPVTNFDGGGLTEWPLACGDMNNDGIFDLVIGAQSSATVIVRLGLGNGSFAAPIIKAAGGAPWMLSVGDVNGDGFEDVAVANGATPNGAILLGNGTGTLGTAVTYPVDPQVVATDLMDLDGDGDLDWGLSSFGGDWRVLRNGGGGTFTTLLEFDAPLAASCILPTDLDNDGDIDLVLVDENADIIKLVTNSGTAKVGDINLDGTVDGADLAILLGQWSSVGTLLSADLNGDGTVGGVDLGMLLGGWGA